MSGSIAHRIKVLATVVLGLSQNNEVYFGKDFAVKQKNDAPDVIPVFKDDVFDAVEMEIKTRSRIFRSNLNRQKSTKNRDKVKSPEGGKKITKKNIAKTVEVLESEKDVALKSKKRGRGPGK